MYQDALMYGKPPTSFEDINTCVSFCLMRNAARSSHWLLGQVRVGWRGYGGLSGVLVVCQMLTELRLRDIHVETLDFLVTHYKNTSLNAMLSRTKHSVLIPNWSNFLHLNSKRKRQQLYLHLSSSHPLSLHTCTHLRNLSEWYSKCRFHIQTEWEKRTTKTLPLPSSHSLLCKFSDLSE